MPLIGTELCMVRGSVSFGCGMYLWGAYINIGSEECQRLFLWESKNIIWEYALPSLVMDMGIVYVLPARLIYWEDRISDPKLKKKEELL